MALKMNKRKQFPVLESCKDVNTEFQAFEKIDINCDDFSVGRGLNNQVVIPYLCISRNHCKFKRKDDLWIIEDYSTYGIEINGQKLGKGNQKILNDDDVINLEPSNEFTYKFRTNEDSVYKSPKKKVKLDPEASQEIIDTMKMKFEASQSFEIKHIQEKLQNTKQMQTTSMVLKEQLQIDMDRQINQLEDKFKLQIENLNGEKNEVERQRLLLIEQRDAQMATIKKQMEGQISELMDQIKRHNETESELLKENNILKENLLKEREEFLAELNKESSSKKDMLEKLVSKMKEQEEIRLREKQELQELLQKETEQLRLAKEKELKELEEKKALKELELKLALDEVKTSLEEKILQTEQEKLKAEQALAERVHEMKKLSDEEKVKRDQLIQEREAIQNQLAEAQRHAEASLAQLRLQVSQRETELAALAADRIQQQAEQSSEVIKALQDQLERVTGQLQSVETEKNTLLESFCLTGPGGDGSSKETALAEVGELMESELQCSICAELFMTAITLNCSHTFCRYCIDMWKKKKRECPNCRTPIVSECKSLALDTFIEKMVQNFPEDMKQKRLQLLQSREAEITAMRAPPPTTTSQPRTTNSRRRRSTTRNSRTSTITITPTAMSISITRAAGATLSTTPATSNRIPIVDLTTIPPTQPPLLVHRPPPPPPPTPPARQTIRAVLNSTSSGQWLIVQAVAGGGAGAFQVVRAHTTAATGAVSSAERAATGPPAAPSERPRPN